MSLSHLGWGLTVETFLENKSEMCLFSPFVLMSVLLFCVENDNKSADHLRTNLKKAFFKLVRI
jgi:hypothetical protein